MPEVSAVDPFDLPEWLGEGEVTWTAISGVAGASQVTGTLHGAEGPHGADDPLPCDLLAADVAYPEPVVNQEWRRAAHQQWSHGQVLLTSNDGRLTLVVPGTAFTADLTLECLARLARAVGAKPARFVAALRL